MELEPITLFRGPYSFLSNFHIEPDGTCVEVEYQRSKCVNKEDRELFKNVTPTKAKYLGRKIELRTDWEGVKLTIMRHFVLSKFLDHSELRRKLIETGERRLIEGNWWGDRFWGVYEGAGENNFGKILMAVRTLVSNPNLDPRVLRNVGKINVNPV